MKYFIILALLCLSSINKIHSYDFDKGQNCSILQLDTDRKYVRYQLGLIDIYIADGDSICDVSIERRGKCVTTTCTKSPILKWAFDEMPEEITMSQKRASNSYNPFYYKLSILNDNSQTIISSSELITDYTDDINKKIKELKAFIMGTFSIDSVMP